MDFLTIRMLDFSKPFIASPPLRKGGNICSETRAPPIRRCKTLSVQFRMIFVSFAFLCVLCAPLRLCVYLPAAEFILNFFCFGLRIHRKNPRTRSTQLVPNSISSMEA